MKRQTLQIGDVTFDVASSRIEKRGKSVQLEPLIAAVLRHLAESMDVTVTRTDLIRSVWGMRHGSDESLNRAVSIIRRSFQKVGAQNAKITTISRRGYCLSAAKASNKKDVSDRTEKSAEATRPSIAILPFVLSHATRENSLLSQAVPFELRRQLANVRWLRVISHWSAARPEYTSLLEKEGKRGTDYIVTGLIENERARATQLSLELIYRKTNTLLWSDTFRFKYENFSLDRESILASVVHEIDTMIGRHAQKIDENGPMPSDKSVWARYHDALRQYSLFSADGNRLALRILRNVIAVDPGFARAHALSSAAHFQEAFMGYSDNTAEHISQAYVSASDALRIDPREPTALCALGRAQWLAGDIECGLSWVSRANELCPSYAQSRYTEGLMALMLDKVEQARIAADEALRLSPLDPFAHLIYGLKGLIFLRLSNYQEAELACDKAVSITNSHAELSVVAAVAKHFSGRTAEARRLYQNAVNINPDFSLDSFVGKLPIKSRLLRGSIAEVICAYAK